VGGTAEAVAEGETGLLFAPQDAAELAAKLRRFLAEPALAGRLGTAAREKAVRDYSLERAAESYEKLYGR
ncbi:MAG: glycosyltransferase, partial [Elusimicrobia bacterium]|nr:glycosyltransferase [Elusimicrobiota bacterium]